MTCHLPNYLSKFYLRKNQLGESAYAIINKFFFFKESYVTPTDYKVNSSKLFQIFF